MITFLLLLLLTIFRLDAVVEQAHLRLLLPRDELYWNECSVCHLFFSIASDCHFHMIGILIKLRTILMRLPYLQ